MTYDFDDLEDGEMVVLEIETADGVETVEAEFDSTNKGYRTTVRVRAESGRYSFCEDWKQSRALFQWEECPNCGQMYWPARGEVLDVDVPGHAERDQQTLSEIADEASEGGDPDETDEGLPEVDYNVEPCTGVDPDHVRRILRRLDAADLDYEFLEYDREDVAEILPVIKDEITDVEAVIEDYEHHVRGYDPSEQEDAEQLADDYRTLVAWEVLSLIDSGRFD